MNFEEVLKINVNDKTEKKVTGSTSLTYLSWAWAWGEFKKVYPQATYEIKKFDGIPYVYDPNTGYMVYTSVTVENLTYEMWLPVMDGANKAMKADSYEYTTKFGTKTVEPASMFDINKTIMRCLAKNLAMFGLGLYIYAGEDLPEGSEKTEPKKEQSTSATTPINQGEKIICSACKCEITSNAVKNYSLNKYGKILCRDCQNKEIKK